MERGTRPARRAIYVDLDDVLSLTIEPILELLAERHGRRVAVEEVSSFDLGGCLGLAPDELDALMRDIHAPERLAAFEPAQGAATVLEGWRRLGYEVAIMTGRPPSSAEISRAWMRRHGLSHARLRCVDKYARADWHACDEPALAFEALGGMGFALAVEDSAEVAARLAERFAIPVALMDRPWNRSLPGLTPAAARRVVRCRNWGEIADRFPAP